MNPEEIASSDLGLKCFQKWITDWVQQEQVLTLKSPITTAAVDKFCNIFPNSQLK